jgi:hypothetical protein
MRLTGTNTERPQVMTALEKELLAALKAAVKEWKTQTRLAVQLGGELAVNEHNGPAFVKAERAIAKAERL